MLMVIFGAGASYDSISSLRPETEPWLGVRPPLAKELFRNIENFREKVLAYPQCQAIITYLEHDDAGTSIEETLGRLDAESKERPDRARQLLALRYYICSVIRECETNWIRKAGGVSNYKTLLDQIQAASPAVLVTFNYDTLLERAVGRKFAGANDYINGNSFSVIKLHGSIDWLQIADGIVWISSPSEREIIDSASSLSFGSIVHSGELRPRNERTGGFVPALAIPIADKRDFVCPPEHRGFLGETLKNVTKILIIGWRASEKHFLKMLRERLPKNTVRALAVCGTKAEAQMSLDQLTAGGVEFTSAEARDGGFTDFVRSRYCEEFLAS